MHRSVCRVRPERVAHRPPSAGVSDPVGTRDSVGAMPRSDDTEDAQGAEAQGGEEVEAAGPAEDAEVERKRLSHIRFLNSKLPRKRNIAQGLLRNEDGEVLLCELTYKGEWDLPGGVVDPGESPATAVEREVEEELSADVTVHGLVAVNWLPPWRGWDDAVLFLFDLGVVPRGFVDDVTLLRRELRAVHWVAPADIGRHVAPYTTRLLEQVLEGEPAPAREGGRTAYGRYVENSEVPEGWA